MKTKTQKAQLRIAFRVVGGKHWAAGTIYLRNLFYALRQTYKKEVELYLMAPGEQENIGDYANFIQPDDVIFYRILESWGPFWAIDRLIKRLLSRDIIVKKALRTYEIDVLFGPWLVYKYPQIATLSWLPDFQHIHLPEMFSEAERLSRDKTFLQSARSATRIILLSEAAKKDFESFAPNYTHKAIALHPISYVPQSVYNYDLNSIQNLYHLPEKFVYLPNQFWKHKNHELVFNALKILKDGGIKITLVCTGYPGDRRHPSYLADLWQEASQLDIRDQVIYIGLVPHEHVFLLIRQSICVLNPSLFEGWGISADEARSVGKHVLLSDIPPHREQNIPRATFFDPRDCEDLAKKLEEIWCESLPGPDKALEYEARHSLPQRTVKYAEEFMSVIQEIVNR